MHDVFTQGILPIRLLPDASNHYFEPSVDEFRPRNAWSLHNAFTAVAKEMPITTRMPAIQELGKTLWDDSMKPANPNPNTETIEGIGRACHRRRRSADRAEDKPHSRLEESAQKSLHRSP